MRVGGHQARALRKYTAHTPRPSRIAPPALSILSTVGLETANASSICSTKPVEASSAGGASGGRRGGPRRESRKTKRVIWNHTPTRGTPLTTSRCSHFSLLYSIGHSRAPLERSTSPSIRYRCVLPSPLAPRRADTPARPSHHVSSPDVSPSAYPRPRVLPAYSRPV